jgi:hypothetical protein
VLGLHPLDPPFALIAAALAVSVLGANSSARHTIEALLTGNSAIAGRWAASRRPTDSRCSRESVTWSSQTTIHDL